MQNLALVLLAGLLLFTSTQVFANDTTVPHYLIADDTVYLSDALDGRLKMGSVEKSRLDNMLERSDAFVGQRPAPSAPVAQQPSHFTPSNVTPTLPQRVVQRMMPSVPNYGYYSGPFYSW